MEILTQDGNIDVWWLFDDGGLSLLIPHLISLHKGSMIHRNKLIYFFLLLEPCFGLRT